MTTTISRWAIPADLAALAALRNNRDRIYGDMVVAQAVISGAERLARARGTSSSGQCVTASDVAEAMRNAGLEYRTNDYVCTIEAWVKPAATFDPNWGD